MASLAEVKTITYTDPQRLYIHLEEQLAMAPISLDDTIINQTNVNIARCQRLIASWLPPPSAHDLQHSKTEAEVEEEDKRTFIPEPEVYDCFQAHIQESSAYASF